MLNSKIKRPSHQELVDKANESVESVKEVVAKDPQRCAYHFMAPAYWINDPNGLIYFRGEYHLFYQHNPYGPLWGAMHWGHAKSKDLVHWEYLPIALAPSEDYDYHERGGCFSGSAVDDNGLFTLIYTGTVLEKDGQVKQVQCVATSTDGITFTKYPGNPVINQPPVDGSSDFRDPKVWKHHDTWYMVVGSCKNGKGKALLYKSLDLRNWDYVGVLAESDGTKGTMWECPDFFPLGDKYVLIVSPMGMDNHKVIYMVGNMDYGTGRFTSDRYEEVDYGFDFYAPQTFLDGQGRRIMIGWMNSWDWMPWFKSFGPTVTNNWCGIMSVPRVLSLDSDGRLIFQPVEELKSLRRQHRQFKDFEIVQDSSNILGDFKGNCLEVIGEFDLNSCNANEFGFKLRCSSDGKEQTYVKYNTKAKELIFVRNKLDASSEEIRRCKVEISNNKTLKLHIFIDRISVEVFVNEGKVVMSSNIYPSPSSQGIDIFSHGGTVKMISLDVWQLKSIWQEDKSCTISLHRESF
ncbi:glycoside hydrolase family 32 protein [Petroclostridium xylanilyticum]|uniref:glycoside hydrolase family 32 protein n=1 Tax=Petroclostridium xylanilyticum TaxID=1792311 RepID=UPI000B97D747|nr:glycoside hydrolase family 32 protein [Petroclostridium xylanilyticum]